MHGSAQLQPTCNIAICCMKRHNPSSQEGAEAGQVPFGGGQAAQALVGDQPVFPAAGGQRRRGLLPVPRANHLVRDID